MTDVRLLGEADFDAFITIAANAYPDFDLSSATDREKLKQRLAKNQFENPTAHLYGLFREEQLLGGMMFHDFTTNFDGIELPIGGVGFVAVDFYHKKQQVAKEMIAFYLRYYRDQGANLATLYPFRPDFYKQMGFGYGTKVNQYRIKPSNLPAGGNRRQVRVLGADAQVQMVACYTRYYQQTHGLFAKSERDFGHLFDNSSLRIVGYWRGDALAGYSVFKFTKGIPPLGYELELLDLVYEDREALGGLLAFFQSQADQISVVTINTQDALFHHLLTDVRSGGTMYVPPVAHESNTAGVSIMYRVLDTAGIFGALSGRTFGGQNCALKLSVTDTFLPENNRSVVVHFHDGKPSVQEGDDYEVEIRLDIAEFSSMLMGVLPFSRLHLYGLAEISDPAAIPTLDRLFATPTIPVCMTRF